MEKKLLLIGGGGHCKSVIDSVLSSQEYAEVGIIDNATKISYQGVETLGSDEDLPLLLQRGWEYAFITVGSVGNTKVRRKLFDNAKTMGFTIPTIVDPTAAIAKEISLGEGVFIGKNAVVNSNASIGTCAIINSGAIIEHDCSVRDFAHISPGTILCGQVSVGCDSHVGAGSVVKQSINIGNDALIGAGSVVVENIPDNAKAYGNPCRLAKK